MDKKYVDSEELIKSITYLVLVVFINIVGIYAVVHFGLITWCTWFIHITIWLSFIGSLFILGNDDIRDNAYREYYKKRKLPYWYSFIIQLVLVVLFFIGGHYWYMGMYIVCMAAAGLVYTGAKDYYVDHFKDLKVATSNFLEAVGDMVKI